MEVFHVGDKVFLDDMKYKYYKKIDIDTEGNQKLSVEDIDCKYGKIIAIDIEDNLMGVSPINDKFGIIFNVNIDSPHVKKIDFLPKDRVIIHDLLKDHYNKKGVVDAYSWQIDRYRVMVDNDSSPHWFAPFELSLEDNFEDDNDKNEHNDENKHFAKSFSTFNPIKVTLSDEGKKAYKYHFGVEPLVDTKGRTEFANLAQFIQICDPTFIIYGGKHMLDDDEIFVKDC